MSFRNELLRATAIGSAAFGTLWIAGPAHAQDAAYDWTGFYVGAGLTPNFSTARTAAFDTPNSTAYDIVFDDNVPLAFATPYAFMATVANEQYGFAAWDDVVPLDGYATMGGTFGFGYDRQFGRVVVGLAADISALHGQHSFTQTEEVFGTTTEGYAFGRAADVAVETGVNWLLTVRPRVGVAFDRILVYGTGGLAYGQAWVDTYASLDEQYVDTGKSANTYDAMVNWGGSTTQNRVGYVLGAGVEAAMSDRLSLQFEGLFYNLGRISTTATGTGSYTVNSGIPTDVTVQPYGVETAVRGAAFKFGMNFRL